VNIHERELINADRVATKSEKKFPEFSRFFQSHKLTFPQVIATKGKSKNDLHQGEPAADAGYYRQLFYTNI